MTKPITATSVMMLLERGDIDLFDPVSRYIPGFQNQQVEINGELVPVSREVNIHDLLNMTSGLVYGGTDKAGQQTDALFQELGSRLYSENAMSTMEFANCLGKGPFRSSRERTGNTEHRQTSLARLWKRLAACGMGNF